MTVKYLSIGEVSELTGLSLRSIRYYDEMKLAIPLRPHQRRTPPLHRERHRPATTHHENETPGLHPRRNGRTPRRPRPTRRSRHPRNSASSPTTGSPCSATSSSNAGNTYKNNSPSPTRSAHNSAPNSTHTAPPHHRTDPRPGPGPGAQLSRRRGKFRGLPATSSSNSSGPANTTISRSANPLCPRRRRETVCRTPGPSRQLRPCCGARGELAST